MVAKSSTTKNEGHRQTTDHGIGSSLKLNSVNAVELKNEWTFSSTGISMQKILLLFWIFFIKSEIAM